MDIAIRVKRSDNRQAPEALEIIVGTLNMYVIEFSNKLLNWVLRRNLTIPHESEGIARDETRVVLAHASEVLLAIFSTTYMRPMGVFWEEAVVDVFTNQPIAVMDCERSCVLAQTR